MGRHHGIRRPRGRWHARLLAAGFLLFLAGCSRAIAVGSSPSAVYAVAVTNAAGEEMIVAYDDGTGPRALGAVADGRTDRFVIAASSRTSVQVSGRNRSGTKTSGPYTVQLVAGQTIPVILR
jgi:hypothetical protein